MFKISVILCVFIFLVTLIFLIFAIDKTYESEEKINYYEKIIQSATVNSLVYKFDLNANRYKPNSTEKEECGTYDFIVIGAGASGSVMANRLSEVEKWSVLVLEAGKYPNDLTDMPGLTTVVGVSDYNWGYHSEPQKHGCQGMVENRCPLPRGRGLGGTTLINGMIYSRGNPKDFNRLEELGNKGWAYENVLKYFMKSENFHYTNTETPIDLDIHGEEGYLFTENNNVNSSLTNIFIEANKEFSRITDYNSPQQTGASYLQVHKRNGKRIDTGTAFLLPVLERPNLNVMTESYVTKIYINKKSKTAKNVLFTNKGKHCRAKARKEIILSAGTYNSPHILMLSGIGKNLSQFGINEIQSLNVGENLHDHVLLSVTVSHNSTQSSQDLKSTIKDFLDSKGTLTLSGPADGTGFYSSVDPESNYPDLKMLVVNNVPSSISPVPGVRLVGYSLSTLQDLAKTQVKNAFSMFLTVLDTKSVGSVSLKSNSPFDYPKINTNVLSDKGEHDINMMYKDILMLKELLNTTAYRSIDAKIVPPRLKNCEDFTLDTKDHWFCVIKQLAIAAWHPMGTCSMGPDPEKGAVVDSELKVHGIKGLRVVDCSIFPYPIRAHPAVNCILAAEKVSDDIKEEYNQHEHNILNEIFY